VHLLLTNDDGYDAPGLIALAEVARKFGRVTVLAPDTHQSGCSHGTTTDRPLEVKETGPGWFALGGTPADCSRVGLLHIARDADWVLSGINDGGNLGVDIYMSGTVAAAREAMLLGVPAMAISQYRKGRPADWARSARDVEAVLSQLLQHPPGRGTLWNVNLPDHDLPIPPETIECDLDPHPLPLTLDVVAGKYVYQSNYQQRRREPGADVDLCFGGRIAITRVGHYAPLPALEDKG
jgi:5'-nucleotidase